MFALCVATSPHVESGASWHAAPDIAVVETDADAGELLLPAIVFVLEDADTDGDACCSRGHEKRDRTRDM